MNIPTWLRVIILLAAGTLAACLLHPIIWHSVDWIRLGYPEGRVFRRLWMIAVVVFLLLGGRWIGLRHPAEVGYRFDPSWFRNLTVGIGCVWAVLLMLTAGYYLNGVWTLKDEFALFSSLLKGLIRGTLVAGIEEYIFRGLIFLSLKERWGWRRAAVVCSLIFSSLHFLEGRGEMPSHAEGWSAGFVICGAMLSQMAHRFTLFPDAVSLFVVGMIMCYGVQRTGSLWYSAGLHGAWVWAAYVLSQVFEPNREFAEFWVGGNRLFDGMIPFLIMFIIFPLTAWFMRKGWVKRANGANSPLQLPKLH